MATTNGTGDQKQIPVANWRPKIGTGDQKQISNGQLANKIFSQWRALKHISAYES